ncbi:MAG: hypothetical protein AAF354_11535 [Pseudomonadota bacterium]
MAGVAQQINDPVEAAKHGVGSSRRLIAATLDDLSDHHSWLETYHRDERIRAERLRRRELRERIERRYRRAVRATKHVSRTSYVGGRSVARVAKRRAHALARWAEPRAHSCVLYVSQTATATWHWSRQHTPLATRRALAALRSGFQWSVQASEQGGYVFRKRAADLSEHALLEVRRFSRPMRRRASYEWTRTRLSTRQSFALVEHRISNWIVTSQTLAFLRRKIYRSMIRATWVGAPLAQRTHAAVMRLETSLSAYIIRVAPDIRQLLQNHLPGAQASKKILQGQTSRALVLRPTTALACIEPIGNRLPVPYRA